MDPTSLFPLRVRPASPRTNKQLAEPAEPKRDRRSSQRRRARAGGRKKTSCRRLPPLLIDKTTATNTTEIGNANGAARSIFFSHRSVRFGHPSPPPFSDPVPPPRTAARRASERARSVPVPGPGGRAPRVEVMCSVSRSCRLQVTRVHLPSPASVGIWECGCLDPLPLDGRAISGQG